MDVSKVFIVLIFVAVAHAIPLTNDAAETSLEENIATFIKKQEFSFEIPYIGSTVSLGARNLDHEEIDLKITASPDQARKSSKLKKIFAPLLILVVLKATTLIPLALGILGWKTWNAIQLSFVAFVVSIAFGVYELCKKVATHHAHPSVIAHEPWRSARSFDEAQDLAYSAYKQ